MPSAVFAQTSSPLPARTGTDAGMATITDSMPARALAASWALAAAYRLGEPETPAGIY
jgi:hypothetical protein